MKKYINGYDNFKIRTLDASNNEIVYNFSFRYQALREFYEKKSILHRTLGGVYKKQLRYIDYEWRILYNDAIDGNELLAFGAIEEAESQGRRIFLTPHIDYPWREFEVIILDEKRTIDMMPHRRGNDNTLNYGYEISFINKYPITNIQMADPNYIPVISTVFFEEY